MKKNKNFKLNHLLYKGCFHLGVNVLDNSKKNIESCCDPLHSALKLVYLVWIMHPNGCINQKRKKLCNLGKNHIV